MSRSLIFVVILQLGFALVGCARRGDEGDLSLEASSEMAQQVGESMSAIDEGGGSISGGFSLSSTCSSAAFSNCVSGTRSRTFSSCTVNGGASLSGAITLAFNGSGVANCTIPSNNDYVVRVPDYTVSTLRGARFTISTSSGEGQRLTRLGPTSFAFSSSGLRRTFTSARGATLIDVTTRTQTSLLISGSLRGGRTITGGTLLIENNLSGASCTLTPSSVTWTSGCSCPTSGQWSGSCTDGDSFEVEFQSSCGSAVVTAGSQQRSVSLDRCSS